MVAVIAVAAAGYWWLQRPPGRYKPDNSGLYPISAGGKYGFMDRSGKTVITPQFDEAGEFSEGLASVRIGTKVGYIDTKGAVVITPQFDGGAGGIALSSFEFRYGRACVLQGEGFGFIDKNGKYIHSPDFRWARRFSGDMAPVTTAEGQAAFVDRSGEVVMPGKFTFVLGFTDGLSAASPVGGVGGWGYIDATGQWVIDPQFEEAVYFADGLAPVKVGGRWGYIDRNGKFIVNPQYAAGDEFYDGYAGVNSGGNVGFIDTKGRMVVEAKFAAAGHFSDGLAPVKTEEGWGFIDSTGHMVITAEFDTADEFRNGLAHVTVLGKDAYVTTAGAFVVNPFPGTTVRAEKQRIAATARAEEARIAEAARAEEARIAAEAARAAQAAMEARVLISVPDGRSHTDLQSFFEGLKKALASNNPRTVAGFMDFPFDLDSSMVNETYISKNFHLNTSELKAISDTAAPVKHSDGSYGIDVFGCVMAFKRNSDGYWRWASTRCGK